MYFLKILSLILCAPAFVFAAPVIENEQTAPPAPEQTPKDPTIHTPCPPHPPGVDRTLERALGMVIVYTGDQEIRTTRSKQISGSAESPPDGSYTLLTVSERELFHELTYLWSYQICKYELVHEYEKNIGKSETKKEEPGAATITIEEYVEMDSNERIYAQQQLTDETERYELDWDLKDPDSLLVLINISTISEENSTRGARKIGYEWNFDYETHNNRLCYRKVVNYNGDANGVEDLSLRLDNCYP